MSRQDIGRMAVGDVYRLISSWLYLGEVCQNVFYYEHIAGSDPNSATALEQGWREDIEPEILACMGETCELTLIETVNFMDVTEFAVNSLSGIFGDIVTGASLEAATFLAFGFRLEKAYPGAPTGHKRFPGVAEGYTAGNVYAPPGAAATALANVLEDQVWDITFNSVFKPVIVKTPFSFTVPPTTWFDVNEVTYTNLTTQNSRKT